MQQDQFSSNIYEVINSVINFFFAKRFWKHQKHQKHQAHKKAPNATKQKHQNTNKQTKTKKRLKTSERKKVTYSPICIFVLAKKKNRKVPTMKCIVVPLN